MRTTEVFQLRNKVRYRIQHWNKNLIFLLFEIYEPLIQRHKYRLTKTMNEEKGYRCYLCLTSLIFGQKFLACHSTTDQLQNSTMQSRSPRTYQLDLSNHLPAALLHVHWLTCSLLHTYKTSLLATHIHVLTDPYQQTALNVCFVSLAWRRYIYIIVPLLLNNTKQNKQNYLPMSRYYKQKTNKHHLFRST